MSRNPNRARVVKPNSLLIVGLAAGMAITGCTNEQQGTAQPAPYASSSNSESSTTLAPQITVPEDFSVPKKDLSLEQVVCDGRTTVLGTEEQELILDQDSMPQIVIDDLLLEASTIHKITIKSMMPAGEQLQADMREIGDRIIRYTGIEPPIRSIVVSYPAYEDPNMTDLEKNMLVVTTVDDLGCKTPMYDA